MKTIAEQKAEELVESFDEILTYLESKAKVKECAVFCIEQVLLFAYDVEWEKKEEALKKMKLLKEIRQAINK